MSKKRNTTNVPPFRTTAKDMFIQTALENKEVYHHYLTEFSELCVSSFRYKNLPDSIDYFYMESVLMERGAVLLFRDEILGKILALPFLPSDNFTVYNEPYGRMAYGANGYTYDGLTPDNSVIVYNNTLKRGSLDDIVMFSNMLWFYESIIKMNALCQAHPFILKADDEMTKLSLQNLWKDITGLCPVIRTKSSLVESVDVLDLKAEFNADRIHDIKNKVYEEALESLGVRSVNTEKKERLITGEVENDNAASDALYNSRILSRYIRFKKFNEMFGENVEVMDRNGNVYSDTAESVRNADRLDGADNTEDSGGNDSRGEA